MTHTRDEVLAAAEAMFGQCALAEVLAVLDEYGIGSHEREVDRVKLAILHLSDGQKDKLVYWTKVAKVDYRDPLAAHASGPMFASEGARLQGMAKDLIGRWAKT